MLDRLNGVAFNALVVLEVNAIEAVNRLLEAAGTPYDGGYKPIRFHAICNDAFEALLGFVSKGSTSAALLSALFDAGQQAAEDWVEAHLGDGGCGRRLM